MWLFILEFVNLSSRTAVQSSSVQFSSCAVNSAVGKHRIFCHSAVLYGRIFRAIRRRERRTKSMAAPSVASSAAAARRLSCVGGSTTLHPPPPSAIAPTAPRSVCPLEEPTVDRPDGCSSVVVDAPRSPPPRPAANIDHDVVIVGTCFLV